MKALARKLYALVVTLEWALLIAIALEALAVGYDFFAERMYKDYYDAQNEKVYRMAPPEELARPENQFSLPESAAETSSPRPPPRPSGSGAQGRGAATPDDIQRERDAYAALSEENRSVIATLQGELVLLFDRDGTFLASYGEPRLEQRILPLVRGGKGISASTELLKALASVDSVKQTARYEFSDRGNALIQHYEALVSPKRSPNGQPEGIEVLIRDISDSKPIEQRRARQERKSNEIVDDLPDGTDALAGDG